MKPSIHRLLWPTAFLLSVLVALTSIRAAEAEAAAAVVSPVQRQEVIDAAKKLIAHRNIVAVTADPFHPEGFNDLVAAAGRVPGAVAPAGPAEAPRPAAVRTEHDVLETIAAGLKPSGFYVLGGQATLVFGQKRVKAGESMTITFEGTEYTLEITAIAPPNFTLRLNREEFTRTIK